MSSHGDGKDAVNPGGVNKVKTHEVKMGTMSSDLAIEVSSKRRGDMADRDDIEGSDRRDRWLDRQSSERRYGNAMSDMSDSEEDNEAAKNTGWSDPMRGFHILEGIRLKLYRSLLIIALSDTQRLAITDRFGTAWSFPLDIPAEYSIWKEFVRIDRTLGLTSVDHRSASEADLLVEMVDTGILSKDKWLWEYLLTFDGSAEHIIAAICQSVFLYDMGYLCDEHPLMDESMKDMWDDMGYLCDEHPLMDESMKDMWAVGKLTIMLYRGIHVHHFCAYFAGEFRRLSNKLYRDMLSEFIKWSNSAKRGISRMDPITPSNMVEWLIRSIKETVEDVRARAQLGYIPDENKLPSNDEVWNRAKSLKERLHDLKLCATDNNDENVLVRNMPISILCSAAAQELDLSICQRLCNKQFVLSKLEVSKSLDLDYINKLGGLVCVIEAVKVETGVKVCSCIIKDNLAGLLICMDVGNDRVDTKRRIFVKEAFRYVGTLQVTVTKERTTIESCQNGGSYFKGDLEDFSFGNHKASCAAKALSSLPGSEFLQQSGLQCTALHMIVLAICAGVEEFIQLQWNGERGHIECDEVERYINHNSKEGGFEVPYSECCMFYTEEGRELARDVLWGMESLNRQYTPQPASTIRNLSTGLILRGPSTSDVGIQVSTIASTSTEAWREAATRIPCPPEAIGEDIDDTAIAAISISDRDERLLREALTKMLYPPEAPTIEEKGKLDETAIAAVLMANKKNFSAGVSILGFGLQGSWERRSSGVERLVKEYVKKQLSASAYAMLTLVPPESRAEVHRLVESKFMNGSLKEDKDEYLVIRNAGDHTCVQVFFCDHSTKKLIFLTDIAVGNGNIVTKALKNFKGSWLEARRFGSDIEVSMHSGPRLTPQLPYAPKILRTGQDVLRKMGEGPGIDGFPRSQDQWKHIIGARRDHEGKGLYWNATEMEAVICAATWFTTGNAMERTLKDVGGELHGGCTSSNVPEHRISSSNVCAIGRFSNFKGLDLRKIYWG